MVHYNCFRYIWINTFLKLIKLWFWLHINNIIIMIVSPHHVANESKTLLIPLSKLFWFVVKNKVFPHCLPNKKYINIFVFTALFTYSSLSQTFFVLRYINPHDVGDSVFCKWPQKVCIYRFIILYQAIIYHFYMFWYLCVMYSLWYTFALVT